MIRIIRVRKLNYWNQFLVIIGNYCFSKPQQEAQEPKLSTFSF